MSTLAVNTITNAAGGNTAQINGMTPTAQSLQGFRNRVINGSMVIDQRNNGASVNGGTTVVYPVDRFAMYGDANSKFTGQRSATAPAGFTNSVLVTSSSAYSVGAGEVFTLSHFVEGFNVADLGFGTASAQTITLSFWVRSSLTGTFGGAIQNGTNARSYPFTYTISAANTFEYKTVTIAGDTSGTWATDNGLGMALRFGMGVGSTKSGTAGAWAGSDFRSATGAVSVVGTSGATFYITGVQLEAGSVATPFERRPYGAELALCQRYYYRLTQPSVNSYFPVNGVCTAGNLARVAATFPVTMRAVPTALDTTGTASNYGVVSTTGTSINLSAVPSLNDTTANGGVIGVTVSSGLTAGHAALFYANTAGAYVGWSAEL